MAAKRSAKRTASIRPKRITAKQKVARQRNIAIARAAKKFGVSKREAAQAVRNRGRVGAVQKANSKDYMRRTKARQLHKAGLLTRTEIRRYLTLLV